MVFNLSIFCYFFLPFQYIKIYIYDCIQMYLPEPALKHKRQIVI